jgi:MFS superfamily sulfate permease-like transporter
MPKSKVRKKPAYAGGSVSRTPVKVKAGPSNPVYVAVMLGVMVLGLLWLVVNYLAGNKIPFMMTLGAWNFLIGFVLMVIGLLMTMRWR